MKEWAAKREAERKRREEARKRLPRFYRRAGWWVSVTVNLGACVSCAFLAEKLVAWTVGLFGVQIPDVSLLVTTLMIIVSVWAIAHSIVAAAYYAEDSESAPEILYSRGLLGGWSLAYNNFELGAALAGSFPLSLILGWALARGSRRPGGSAWPCTHSGSFRLAHWVTRFENFPILNA